MNTINGQPYSYYGLLLSKIEGVLDMPSRLGDVFYDWGDFIEPLVNEADISWNDRDISVDVFFDGHRYNKTLNECLNLLKSLPDTIELETNYGVLNVKLKQVLKTKGFTQQYANLKLIFNENTPSFSNITLSTPAGGNGITIDGYDFFNDFGILVSETKFHDDIPVLKQSNVTVFNTSKPFTKNRNIRSIQFSCNIPFSSPVELRETTEKFRKLLSQQGTRDVIYNARTYSCFLSDGFNVQFEGTNLAKFLLKLNIATNFVEHGFVARGFITAG